MALLSTVVGIYCTVPYVIAILKRRTRPHQLSWLVFVIMNGMVLLSQFLEGGRGSILIALTFFVGSMLILILSFRYGTRDTSRWDKALFSFAILTIIVWIFTKNNVLAIWLTVLIDVAATAMIILKLRTQPHSEAAQPWALAALAYVFSCLSLAGTPFGALYIRPVWGLASDGALLLAILYYSRRGPAVEAISPAEN